MPPAVRMVLGTAAHKAVETNYVQKVTTQTDIPEADALDAYSTSFDSEIEEVETPDEPVSKAKDQGVELVKLYHSGSSSQPAVAPRVQPLLVEKPVQFRLIDTHDEGCDGGTDCSCGVVFNSTVDLVDSEEQVRDLKTTARTPTGGAHLMQVAAGAIGYEVTTGRPAKDIVIDTLVRIKVPKYIEEKWGGPVDSHMRKVFAAQVNSAARMINAGNFPTLGTEGVVPACGNCGYKPRCPAWKRRK